MKKLVCMLMAIAMLLALTPAVFADEPTGTVMLYSSMQEDQLMAIEKAFEAKYPGIDM